MLSYILETARDVYKCRPDAGFDEVAAIAGVKVGIVQGYFATEADLRAQVALTAAESRLLSASTVRLAPVVLAVEPVVVRA